MQTARQIYPNYTISRPMPVKVKKQAEKTFEFTGFLRVLLFVGVFASIYVCQVALIAQNNIEISRIKSEIKESIRQQKALRVQEMLLRSPSRLERIATNKLGMVKPAKITYILMPPQLLEKPKLSRQKKLPTFAGIVLTRLATMVK